MAFVGMGMSVRERDGPTVFSVRENTCGGDGVRVKTASVAPGE